MPLLHRNAAFAPSSSQYDMFAPIATFVPTSNPNAAFAPKAAFLQQPQGFARGLVPIHYVVFACLIQNMLVWLLFPYNNACVPIQYVVFPIGYKICWFGFHFHPTMPLLGQPQVQMPLLR
jgi:hypothetical protein